MAMLDNPAAGGSLQQPGKTQVKPTVIGWLVIATGLYYISKSRDGKTLIYFSLLLTLVMLVLSNYAYINAVLFKTEVVSE